MTMSDLPKDLVEEILFRIPATTLIRLRSTCKQWNALLSDQKFTQKHLSKAPQLNMVVMLKHFRVYLMAVNLHGTRNSIVDPSIMVSGKFSLSDPRYDSEVDISDIFHCDGLLLCTTKDNTRLVVWNPCTGKTKWIERRNEYYHKCEKLFGEYELLFDSYVLGYENNTCSPNYKILRVLFCRHIFKVEIYEFNTDSWRVLELTPDWLYIRSYGVPLKGNTYWFGAKKLPESKEPVLISFDFTTEMFGCLSLPARDEYMKRDLSSVKEGQLSVLYLTYTSQIEIWVTNEIKPNFVSWGKFFTVDVMALRTTHRYPHHMNFLFDKEKKVVVYCAEKPKEDHSITNRSNMIYIAGEDGLLREEDLGETSTSDCPFLLMSYVPSLVKI